MGKRNEAGRIDQLLRDVFADEGLHEAKKRLAFFFNSTFLFETEKSTKEITQLLFIENDISRLIDASYMLPDNISPLSITKTNPIETCKYIRAELTSWDDFPSFLHPNEWASPEIAIAQFFELQGIEDWKDAVHALLETVVTQNELNDLLSEFQLGIMVLQINRLIEAVWLLRVCRRIHEPGEEMDSDPIDEDRDQKVVESY